MSRDPCLEPAETTFDEYALIQVQGVPHSLCDPVVVAGNSDSHSAFCP
jgi:hypothetical protein